MPKLINRPGMFLIVVGSRQIGKTYGTLKYICSLDKKYIFLRRTKTALDTVTDPKISPFLSLQQDGIAEFSIKKNKMLYNIYQDGEEDPRCMAAALSTFSNLRGFSGREYEYIIYDEFIGENHERPMKDEAGALFNMIETVNSNRELSGQRPVKVILLANSNRIINPIFMGLNLVTVMEKMQRDGLTFYENQEQFYVVNSHYL